MIRLAALAAALLVLGGCDIHRNSPAEQVEDYNTCKAAGMRPYRTVMGEIKCDPYLELLPLPTAEPEPTFPDGTPCLGNVACQDFDKRRRGVGEEEAQ